jgi:hypothetical protein
MSLKKVIKIATIVSAASYAVHYTLKTVRLVKDNS